MNQYNLTRLRPEAARLAYPLVRAIEPLVDLASWIAYVRRAQSERHGVMIATRHGCPFPSGLFCFRCSRELSPGNVITADYFVALDILDPAPLTDAMITALEKLASELHCDAIRSVVRGPGGALRETLLRRGHAEDAMNFQKLPPAGGKQGGGSIQAPVMYNID
jgi:hypothetical protein